MSSNWSWNSVNVAQQSCYGQQHNTPLQPIIYNEPYQNCAQYYNPSACYSADQPISYPPVSPMSYGSASPLSFTSASPINYPSASPTMHYQDDQSLYFNQQMKMNQNSASVNVSPAHNVGQSLEYHLDNSAYAPCQGPQPWSYAYCYGYYGESPCTFIETVDMEDFM